MQSDVVRCVIPIFRGTVGGSYARIVANNVTTDGDRYGVGVAQSLCLGPDSVSPFSDSRHVLLLDCTLSRVMLKYAGEHCEAGDASCRSCSDDVGIS